MKTYGPTMQFNSKTLDDVKCPKCPPLGITHDFTPDITNQSLVNQTSPQLINISTRCTPVALATFCNQQDWYVWYVNKPQIWCYNEVWQLDCCAHTLCWRTVLFKLLCFRSYKDMKYACDRNVLRYMCANIYQNRPSAWYTWYCLHSLATSLPRLSLSTKLSPVNSDVRQSVWANWLRYALQTFSNGDSTLSFPKLKMMIAQLHNFI